MEDSSTRDRLISLLQLAPGETLARALVFESIVRGETSFSLALVAKRLVGGGLEMIAIGGRGVGGVPPAPDFVRRARFPEAVFPEILEELIDRHGLEGAGYRELTVAAAGPEAIAGLADELLGIAAAPAETPA